MNLQVEKICLSCKFFRVRDAATGICRVHIAETGDRNADKPAVATRDHCAKWQDSGQDYYIRLGWIKNLEQQHTT